MVTTGARNSRVLGHRLSAISLLLSILLLSVASDRFHNHSGAEEALFLSSGSPQDESFNRHAPFPESHRPLVCVACLHHRTYGVGSPNSLHEGPIVVLPDIPGLPAPAPPPAPLSRPAGLRAPPTA
jgi:hypothetical protein